MGFSAIMYISALSGVDRGMHEAAIIDGATKLQRIWYIDLPTIMPTAMIMLIFAMGGIMGVDMEKSLLLQNSLNLPVSDVLSTYVYRVGLTTADFGIHGGRAFQFAVQHHPAGHDEYDCKKENRDRAVVRRRSK